MADTRADAYKEPAPAPPPHDNDDDAPVVLARTKSEGSIITVIVHDEQEAPLQADEVNEPPLIPPTADRPWWVNSLLLVLIIGFGMLEGAGFQRSGMFIPQAIAGQMVFKVWITMKLFGAAVGSSMVTQGIMNLVSKGDFDRSRDYKKPRAGLVRAVIGSVLLGVGMTLSGSGPTMLPSQIGGGVGTAWVTLLGSLFGGLVFAIAERLLPALFERPLESEDFTVDTKVRRFRYELLAIPAGLCMVGVCVGLEFVVTQADDEEKLGNGPLPWYPTVAGAIIGVGQVPLRLIAGHGQGGSSSIMVVIGTLTCGLLAPDHRLVSFQQAWQFAFVWIGSTLGSLASSQINEFPYPDGVTYWRAAVGGFLALFGARIAGGCTCGHGVSGFAELSLESAVAACCIFGAGIATGFIVQAAGGEMCCHA